MVKATTWLAACGLVLFSSLLIHASSGAQPQRTDHRVPPAHPDRQEPLCGGEPCTAVERGFRAFFDRTLDGLAGNGRACADCHMAAARFQLSPADVERR